MAGRRIYKFLLLVAAAFTLMPSICSAAPLLVNQSHPLQPYDYVPPQLIEPSVPIYISQIGEPESKLTPSAAAYLEQLFNAANSQNILLILSSGYRPFVVQERLFKQAVSDDKNQKLVAPPGFSEHQTGLAADVATENQFCVAQGCFVMTKAADWLARNAYHYGFIIRYPRDKTAITGYEYEPWHLRYVGKTAAEQMHRTQETLEEYVSRASA